jgi:crotonobetainyl-CoA:carnitine CoA-transferase CaiB-like acyl-CoA transferase
VVFGTGGESNQEIVDCDGLGGEAMSGVIGTMGDVDSPTPFGYLFGEVNVAVRGAAALVDQMLTSVRAGAPLPDDLMLWVTAADACIDAMDNPWQEYSLPGPVHSSPNSLTGENYLRTGPQKVGLVPYGLFQARDSWVGFVGASTTDLMAERLQRPDLLTDERFATVEGRVANREFVIDLLQQWIGGYESGEELVETLGERVVVAVSRSLFDVHEAHRDILGFDNSTQPYRISTVPKVL